MELWDLYDKDRSPLGRTHVRGVPLEKGEYHLVVFVWTFNSRGQVLMTKRAPEKQSYAGLWEHTGGSVQAGETSLQAILRELQEETGIGARPEELRLAESYRRSNDICDVYFLKKDVPLEQICLQPGETCDAKWVTRAQLEEMIQRGEVAKPDAQRYRQLGNKLEGLLK